MTRSMVTEYISLLGVSEINNFKYGKEIIVNNIRYFICIILLFLMILTVSACSKEAAPTTPDAAPSIVFSDIDFTISSYKHITNGGRVAADILPYNIDAITGATVTVEGPALRSSIPLSIREIENRNDGLSRGAYTDSAGTFIYEGLDLYYILSGMTSGDSGIVLTDKAYKVLLKNVNRVTIAEISIEEVKAAHERGRPYLLAYGIGTIDEEYIAPFVYNAANPNEHSEGYIFELDNADGCLKFVYDIDSAEIPNTRFSNVSYVYVCEGSEPGFKHSTEPYSSSRFTDYILTFRGESLGREMVFTVGQLESLINYDDEGNVIKGGVGYTDSYSLANNAYWYVNEYEGLDLYKLLLYLGMSDAQSLGLATARTTLIRFVADDGFRSPESFSIDTLSYPDTFGFYNKNALDKGDGTYRPSNADLVDTGYPVLLAYGVNRYPYTITKQDAGYLSGLSNSGGPIRVVFGKTQYNHPNGSNQVQLLREVIAGSDKLYNTHKYTDIPAHLALANSLLSIAVNGEDGVLLKEHSMTVGDIEDIIYGEKANPAVKKAAKIKDHYQRKIGDAYVSEIYEGVSLEYFFMEVIGLPGTNGTVTFTSSEGESATVTLSELMRSGYNTQLGRDKLSPIIAFAKNGSPMVVRVDDPGYQNKIALKPMLEHEPAFYTIDNFGGPLAVFIPSSDPNDCNALSLLSVASITIDLVPDSDCAGFDSNYKNDGGAVMPILPSESTEDSLAFRNNVAVEVTANEIGSWSHMMSDVYSEFLDFEFTFTVRNNDSEWNRVFTVSELESMTDLIVRENYSVLDIGVCEGIDIWKFIKRLSGNIPGIDDPIAITVYAADGYKNDLLSVFYKEGFELGVADGDGNRKPLIIAYAINGLPLVDSENHEGYTGLAGNANGPLRVIAETNQGASVKYVTKLVVTIPGSGTITE